MKLSARGMSSTVAGGWTKSPIGGRALRPMVAATVALALLAGLAACDRKDPAFDTLSEASLKMRTSGGAGEGSRPLFSEVSTNLQELSRNGERSGSTASLLVASSQLGLSDGEFAKYLASETESLALLDSVRSAAAQYRSMQEAAKGADAFSLATEMGRINGERAKQNEALSGARAEREKAEQEITRLRGESKAKLDAANAKLAEAARLTENLARLSSEEGSRAISGSHDIKVRAESDRRAGLELEARAAVLQPVMDEWGLRITQHEGQLAYLAESEKSLQEQERLARQSAADARSAAGKAAEQLGALVNQVQTLRAGPLEENSSKALATLKKALDASREASKPGGNPGQAALVAGMAQQAIGELQWSRAAGHAAFASAMTKLAQMQPALPAASDYAAKAQAASASQAEATEAAKQAFGEAQRAFDRAASSASGPGNAPAKEQLKALAARYGKLSGAAQDSAVDAAATPEASAAPAAETPAPAPAATASYDPALREAIQTNITAAKASKDLDDAMKEKFGKTLTQLAASMPGAEMMAQSEAMNTAFAGADIATLQVTVSGDNATIAIPGSPAFKARKMGGAWVIVPPGMDAMFENPQMAAAAPQMGKIAAGMGQIATKLAAEVREGKHSTPESVMQALMQRMMPMLQQMMMPGGGG